MRPLNVRIEAALATRNEDRRWQLIAAIVQECSDDVLEISLELLRSGVERQRTLGADLLGRLVGADAGTTPAALQALIGAVVKESRPAPLASIVAALGHIGDPSAVEWIVPLAGHGFPEVRLAVAFSLASSDPSSMSASALKALIRLSRDGDAEVRDWATFGLGTLSSADGPDVRAALLARAEDAYPETRAEALFGLALRRDPRAVPHLIRALQSGAPGGLEVDAAAEAADPRLLPALQALALSGRGDGSRVRRAIERCSGREGSQPLQN